VAARTAPVTSASAPIPDTMSTGGQALACRPRPVGAGRRSGDRSPGSSRNPGRRRRATRSGDQRSPDRGRPQHVGQSPIPTVDDELDGHDPRALPLGDRKKRLARLIGNRRLGSVLSRNTDYDGAAVFRHACWMGLEGIVLKRLSAPYRHSEKTAGLSSMKRTEVNARSS
jgi:hypothetical protein